MGAWPLRMMPLVLLAALAAFAPEHHAAAGNAADGDAGSTTLSVVTLNLWHDKGDWPRRQALILAELRALQPDVIALQEVLQHEALPNQAQAIADGLGYAVYFVSTDPIGQARRYGNAVLTRHPILARGSRPLQPRDDSRTVAHVRVAIGGRPVDVYATHLHHTREGSNIRARQLQDLRGFITATNRGAPILVAGDFNALASAPELETLAQDYVDGYGSVHGGAASDRHTTLNPAYFDDDARIDHVFAQRGRFLVEEARIILDRAGADGTWPSDHFGVLVRLRMGQADDPGDPVPGPLTPARPPAVPR